MSKRNPEPVELRGTILGFNIGRRGGVKGALVETTTGTVQINFSRHEAESIARSMKLGSTINLKVESESDDGDHRVYSLSREDVAVKGTITRLNYAHRGKANGFHLDNGTFVHVKPNEATKHDLHVGDVVTASGPRHAGDDSVVLDARTVERYGLDPAAAFD
jgi:hypothetical protein